MRVATAGSAVFPEQMIELCESANNRLKVSLAERSELFNFRGCGEGQVKVEDEPRACWGRAEIYIRPL